MAFQYISNFGTMRRMWALPLHYISGSSFKSRKYMIYNEILNGVGPKCYLTFSNRTGQLYNNNVIDNFNCIYQSSVILPMFSLASITNKISATDSSGTINATYKSGLNLSLQSINASPSNLDFRNNLVV